MPSATLIGEEGSGRTTVLGLLYTALVRLGGEPESGLRCHVAPNDLDLLGRLYEDLRSGEFPTWPPDRLGQGDIALSLHVPPTSSGGLLGRALHRGAPAPSSGPELLLHRPETRDLEEFVQTHGGLTRVGQSLMESTSLLLTLDASRWTGKGPDEPHPQDGSMASVLGALIEAQDLHRAVGTPAPLGVMVVLTKWDLAPDRLQHELLPGPAQPVACEESRRGVLALSLLRQYLPKTSEALRVTWPANSRPRFDAPRAFLSWLSPEPVEGQPGRTRLRGVESPLRGWEPAYPYNEYRSLVRALAGLPLVP